MAYKYHISSVVCVLMCRTVITVTHIAHVGDKFQYLHIIMLENGSKVCGSYI